MAALGRDPAVLLSFALGVFTALLGVAAKYFMDYRLGKQRLQMEERAAITLALGNGPGLLRRGTVRLQDRVHACFRDAEHVGRWLRASPTPRTDGYFLRSFVQRMFVFFSMAGVVQSAIDALPAQTLRARADLRRLYALIELSKCTLTHVGLVLDYPGYVVEREGYHLFIGALDDLTDLGVAAYLSHDSTIPVTAFNEHYDGEQPTLMRVRSWLSAAGMPDEKGAVIRARLACLRAVLQAILTLVQTEPGRFAADVSLTKDLGDIPLPRGVDYAFAQTLPRRLDELLPGLQRP